MVPNERAKEEEEEEEAALAALDRVKGDLLLSCSSHAFLEEGEDNTGSFLFGCAKDFGASSSERLRSSNELKSEEEEAEEGEVLRGFLDVLLETGLLIEAKVKSLQRSSREL